MLGINIVAAARLPKERPVALKAEVVVYENELQIYLVKIYRAR